MGEGDDREASPHPISGAQRAPAQPGALPSGSAQDAPAPGHEQRAARVADVQPARPSPPVLKAPEQQPRMEPEAAAAPGVAAAHVGTKPNVSRFAGVKVRIKEFGTQPPPAPAAAAPAQPVAYAVQPIAPAAPTGAATAPPAAADVMLPTVAASAPSAAATPTQATAAAEPADAAAASGPASEQQQQQQQQRQPAAASRAPAAGAAAAAAAAPPVPPPPPLEPGFQEEQHTAKPQWRRGFKPENKEQTAFLFITLTPSDCSTKRLRPPRTWFDMLLGGTSPTLEVHTSTAAGPIAFLLQSMAYDYAKNEYYVQGVETKRMFRALHLQPGDGLKLVMKGRGSAAQPLVSITLRPAAENPHAASVVAAANAAAARRAEAKASRPPKPKGEGSRKRKGAPAAEGATATAAGAAAPSVAAAPLPGAAPQQPQGDSTSRRPAEARRAAPRQRKHKQFGEDFVVTQGAAAVSPSGLDDGAADYADADYVPLPGEDDAGSPGAARRRRRTSTAPVAWLPSAAAPSGALMPAASAAVTTSCSGGQALPEITAIHVGDRNLLKIRVPGKSAATAAQHPADGRQQQQQQQQQGSSGVSLLSRALVRDDCGDVQSAHCRFLLEPGANVPSICRKISAWSLSHKEAQIEDFEAVPAEQVINVHVRLAGDVTGRANMLEAAILALIDALNGKDGTAAIAGKMGTGVSAGM